MCFGPANKIFCKSLAMCILIDCNRINEHFVVFGKLKTDIALDLSSMLYYIGTASEIGS